MLTIVKKYILKLLNTLILREFEERLIIQEKNIKFLSQHIQSLNQPIIEVKNKSYHFPPLDELIYEYKLFMKTISINPSWQTIKLEIDGKDLITDFKYVGQANHKLFMKIVSKNNESVWYDCCETVRFIGLIEKDGCFNIMNDKTCISTTYKRICIIPSTFIYGDCIVFLRFGKKIQDNISCFDIKIFKGDL